jgi:leucyl/phenylalanyl-tRNA--protein transferase
MFSIARDASKVALVHLAARLRAGGFALLDAQFVTDHLTTFGAVEIDKADYLARLAAALGRTAHFHALPAQIPGAAAMQDSSQAS